MQSSSPLQSAGPVQAIGPMPVSHKGQVPRGPFGRCRSSAPGRAGFHRCRHAQPVAGANLGGPESAEPSAPRPARQPANADGVSRWPRAAAGAAGAAVLRHAHRYAAHIPRDPFCLRGPFRRRPMTRRSKRKPARASSLGAASGFLPPTLGPLPGWTAAPMAISANRSQFFWTPVLGWALMSCVVSGAAGPGGDFDAALQTIQQEGVESDILSLPIGGGMSDTRGELGTTIGPLYALPVDRDSDRL